MSEETKGKEYKLVAALAKARLAFKPIKRNTENTFFKSKYASLAEYIDATAEALAQNGLVVIQRAKVLEVQPLVVAIETQIAHAEGEAMDCGQYPLIVGKGDAQAYGSAMTYARRYTYAAALNLTADDDDGNAASEEAPKSRRKASQNAPESPKNVDTATGEDLTPENVEDEILRVAAAISFIEAKEPVDELIRRASEFIGTDGKVVFFVNPHGVKSDKWKRGTLTKLKKALHDAEMRAEPGAAEAAEAFE